MRPRLIVNADTAGLPYAEVPVTLMWDLVEYLSYQRAAVTYQYRATHFRVTFTRQDIAGAQRMLDEWATAASERLQAV